MHVLHTPTASSGARGWPTFLPGISRHVPASQPVSNEPRHPPPIAPVIPVAFPSRCPAAHPTPHTMIDALYARRSGAVAPAMCVIAMHVSPLHTRICTRWPANTFHRLPKSYSAMRDISLAAPSRVSHKV